jgi:hypothetical protein
MGRLDLAKRSICVVAAASGLGVVAAAPATAASAQPTPQHGTFVDSGEFDDTEYCAAEGVPSFHVVETITTRFTVTFNSDGSPRLLIAHHHQEDTFTANGKTLSEDDHWTDFFYPDGSSATVGTHTHIRGDQGIVLRDAGRVEQAPDGSVTFIAGPHPQFTGTTFCQHLLP